MRCYLLAVIFVFAAFVPAAHAFDACKKAKNSTDELACANQKYEHLQEDLSEIYDSILAAQKGEALDAFRTAQQSWVLYRDQECAWEAASDEGEALNRLRELTCLYKVTEARTRLLSSFVPDIELDQTPGQALVESPRWLNALSDSHHDVFWQYGPRLEVDLNCNGMNEVVLTGLRMREGEPEFVVGLSENPAMGLPRNAVFEIAGQDQQDCFEAIAMNPENPENGDEGCVARLGVEAGACGTYTLGWDGEEYRFTPSPEPAAGEETQE